MCRKVTYGCSDVMVILEVKKSTAYLIIKELREELGNMKIPGTNRSYALPPQGRIPAPFFCEKYFLNRADCDEILSKTG